MFKCYRRFSGKYSRGGGGLNLLVHVFAVCSKNSSVVVKKCNVAEKKVFNESILCFQKRGVQSKIFVFPDLLGVQIIYLARTEFWAKLNLNFELLLQSFHERV